MSNPPDAPTIIAALNKLKRKKSAGPDRITAELLQGAGNIAEDMTVNLIQKIWTTGHVPSPMKHANVILIPKTSPPSTDPAEQRPISLLNMWYKVLDTIVKDRILEDMENHNILSDEQAGFRKGRTC